MARKIELGETDFKAFREAGALYIDKTALIEHVLDASKVLLFCRPRRMGKTLNLTMLKYFFDIKEDSAELFKGLFIETQTGFEERNKYPVIYLSFRDYAKSNYLKYLIKDVNSELRRYLSPEQFSEEVKLTLAEPDAYGTGLLKDVTKNLFDVYNSKAIILIDEYDKLIMDNVGDSEFEEIRSFVKRVMSSALKDNPYLEKAVITGVNRIAQESLFSDLNNITVCDVFTKSIFDTDFGFTETEVNSVYDEVSADTEMPFNTDDLRNWYNNYQIGNKKLYFSYSVLSALYRRELGCYWGRSGIMDMIREHLTTDRISTITELLNGYPDEVVPVSIKDRLTVEDLSGFTNDDAFYTLLVQTGYMTLASPSEFFTMENVSLPNHELELVWREFLVSKVYQNKAAQFERNILGANSPEALELLFQNAINGRLSYYDFDSGEPEKTYHVYVAGMFAMLGYKFISNAESGLGRYDLAVELPKYNLIFEFKTAKLEADLPKASEAAIKQIHDNHYDYGLPTDKTTYNIGIGFYKKLCKVKAENLFIPTRKPGTTSGCPIP
ncbi:MAG: ATP-binding protein [Lachnospiraceae bacterium]|jgi:hypothetical protein|nr:ATP-binding protein [Lachnospiraceae bacterium]